MSRDQMKRIEVQTGAVFQELKSIFESYKLLNTYPHVCRKVPIITMAFHFLAGYGRYTMTPLIMIVPSI